MYGYAALKQGPLMCKYKLPYHDGHLLIPSNQAFVVCMEVLNVSGLLGLML